MSCFGIEKDTCQEFAELSCETFNVSQGEQRRVIMKICCQRIRGLKAAEFEFEWFGTSKLLSDRKARLMRAKSCRLFLIVESDGEKRQILSLPERMLLSSQVKHSCHLRASSIEACVCSRILTNFIS